MKRENQLRRNGVWASRCTGYRGASQILLLVLRGEGAQMALGSLQLQGFIFYFSLVAKSAAVLKNDHGQNQHWTRLRYGSKNHAVVHLLPWHTAQHVNQKCWGRGGERRRSYSLQRQQLSLGQNLPILGVFVHPCAGHS